MHIFLIWKENILNRATFPCLFIVKYFDFSASAGSFDISLFNMHTITGTSDSNYIEIEILNIPHMHVYLKTPTTSTARLLYTCISIYYSIELS